MASEYRHHPVLLEESVGHLHLEPGSRVLDGTLGGGGHAEAILERIGPDGVLIGIDHDPHALAAARTRLARFADAGARVEFVHGSFRQLDTALADLGIDGVDGVLLDLGVSSPQIDDPERGFRFSDAERDASPLDMRMDASRGETAADLLGRASRDELEGWFRDYGELPGARRLAAAIVEARRSDPVRTGADLLRLIRSAGVGGGRRHNPATLVFQALRIAVNDELGALADGLDAAIRVLRPGGRLVVIAYHSLEDRMVKQRFRDEARGCTCPPRTPVCVCGGRATLRVVTKRPVRPQPDEVHDNPRARSARLRAAERLADAA